MHDPRGRQNIAFALPLVGLALFVPPIMSVFDVRERVLGVPLGVLYLFAVWVVLVALTARFSYKVGNTENEGRGSDKEPPA